MREGEGGEMIMGGEGGRGRGSEGEREGSERGRGRQSEGEGEGGVMELEEV